MTTENGQVKQKIREAIAAFKAGNRAAARLSLQAVLKIDSTNITALLWLAYLSDNFGERTSFLNKILAIDPQNERAQKGLEWADAQHKRDEPSFFSEKTSPVVPITKKKRSPWLIIILIGLIILVLATLVLARVGQNLLQSSDVPKSESNSIVMIVETFTPAPPTDTATKVAIAVVTEPPSSTATEKPIPTSTATPTPTATATSVPPTQIPTNTPLPAPTVTPLSLQPTIAPTKTPFPTATTVPPTATHTQIPAPTATLIPSTATHTATSTSIPPTATETIPAPTETPALSPTDTAIATPTLPVEVTTATPDPTATATLIVPTATATLVVPSPTPVPPTPLPSPTPIYATQKWIEVDLSEQSLVAWEGNVPVMWMTVSTGLPGTPTVVGNFHIYQKLVSTRMVGPGYDLPNVPHTMYFYQGYALHGAYWHNNFGHPMSHGCVNLSLPDAERLFNWATPVLPAGAWSVYASASNPGSLVVIHY